PAGVDPPLSSDEEQGHHRYPAWPATHHRLPSGEPDGAPGSGPRTDRRGPYELGDRPSPVDHGEDRGAPRLCGTPEAWRSEPRRRGRAGHVGRIGRGRWERERRNVGACPDVRQAFRAGDSYEAERPEGV